MTIIGYKPIIKVLNPVNRKPQRHGDSKTNLVTELPREFMSSTNQSANIDQTDIEEINIPRFGGRLTRSLSGPFVFARCDNIPG